jgi:uncharacterized protein YndB with AHSA1/START domain
MMKWLLVLAAIPLGGAAIVVGVGALLPREHVARGERLLPVPPAAVAAMVRDVEAHPRWRGHVRAVEVIGRSRGGLRYVERSGDGDIIFVMTEEVPDRRFRSTIDDPGLPFGGYWTIGIEPAGRGARIRIDERGHVGNPVYRFFAALVFGHERTMKAYLDDMEAALRGRPVSGAPAAPSA